MDKPNTHWLEGSTREEAPKQTSEQTARSESSSSAEASIARGSGELVDVPSGPNERTEHSVMEGLPAAKAERIAAMRRELADLQRQLIEAQQRIATELQGRAEDAERFEVLEGRLQAQESKAQQDAARIAELETELASVRSQLVSVGATAEELRRDVAGRDAQIEEARRQHSGVTEQLAAQITALEQAKAQLQTRDAELATRTEERDTELATRSRLERELDDERKQHRDVLTQLAAESVAAREAKALVVKLDAELTAAASKRDGLDSELAAARVRMRDVAGQLAQLGKDLGADVVQPPASSDGPAAVTAPSPERPKPPPVPAPRAAAVTGPPHGETIIEVREEPKPASRIGRGLIIGVLLGCAATVGAVKWMSSGSATAAEQDLAGAPASALASDTVVEPAPSAMMPVEGVAGETPSDQPTDQPAPTSDTDVNDSAQRPVVAEQIATDGVIVLPEEAAGHRVFVDGRVVRVKNSRAVIPCGEREIRIGSRGATQTLDVPCGGDTEVTMVSQDR